MSVITHEQEDCHSILSVGQIQTVSRTSTHIPKTQDTDGELLEDLFYSVCIGNSVLTRKPTKQEVKSDPRSSCSNCLLF